MASDNIVKNEAFANSELLHFSKYFQSHSIDSLSRESFIVVGRENHTSGWTVCLFVIHLAHFNTLGHGQQVIINHT